ncbi:hypothetical protein [Halorubrum distributum]|uniref:Rhomboid family protein n=1 Tax=Halorubrum distributum JCM 10247 TaxID=1227486 RepID=M0D0Z6_9EURY|nr:hypothetical protein [Halorubrum terrestre]ELZ27829.1 hypothetical protein C473_16514 [Halorubrum terrestre JCM 10247]
MVDVESPTRYGVGLDFILILSIPILLTSIHFLTPTAFQQQLALTPSDPQWYTIFTAAYVHASTSHLSGNLFGYFLAVSYTYWLCLHTSRRQWFRRTTIALLLVTPIVVNIGNVLAFGSVLPEVEGYSRGFSGVVGGFGGFLLVAFVVAVKDTYGSQLAEVVGMSLVLLLLLLVSVVYSGGIQPLVAGLVAFGIGLQVIGTLYERDWELPTIDVASREFAFQVVSGGLVVTVLAVLVVSLFPAALVEGGTFTNIVGHGVGFLFGSVLSLVNVKMVLRNE